MQPLVRKTYHLILAAFTANAANKFFITDLDFEIAHHFYQDIFAFQGFAPDQYRILPLLLLKYTWEGLRLIMPSAPWNHALLLFNFVCAWGIYEGFFHLATKWPPRKRLTFNLLFAILFIYTLYTAFRPDTLCLLLLCLLTLAVWLKSNLAVLHLVVLTGLAFCRADIALVYGVFWVAYFKKSWVWLLPAIGIPIVIQISLQKWIFPEAVYYTKQFMFWDNLGGFYLRYNPATYGIAAAIVLFWNEIKGFVRETWETHRILLGLFTAYFVLIFLLGRINEYRLYLPFLPLFLTAYHQNLKPLGFKAF